jgi:hypothetical protein
MGGAMRCPHCGQGFFGEYTFIDCGSDRDGVWEIGSAHCPDPACGRLFLRLFLNRRPHPLEFAPPLDMEPVAIKRGDILVWPRTDQSRLCPAEVPSHIADDYLEAVAVLPESAKASAALSRRCLQAVIHEAAKVKRRTLNEEIDEVIARGGVPANIGEQLHYLRKIGGLAAHPTKNERTGEIVDIEPGEADWNLDTLDALFDFYYVQPAKMEQRKRNLNEKLRAAGKESLE